MFEEYLKECFIFNMFGLNIWRRYCASPMQVYPKGDGYADQETGVLVSFRCFIQMVGNGFLRSSSVNIQEQVTYDAETGWDEALDTASSGKRQLSSDSSGV